MSLHPAVSMKSGLEGRNNEETKLHHDVYLRVSMKSGLEGRNNTRRSSRSLTVSNRVSMKSGLEGRNN